MRAIDTNIIVRFLTGDERRQAAKARALIAAADGGDALFIATTVLLETEWVLRSAYEFPPARIVAALRAFCGLPGIVLEDAALAARALDWTARGLDFADALHLGRADGCAMLMSFDRKLVRTAAGLGGVAVAVP